MGVAWLLLSLRCLAISICASPLGQTRPNDPGIVARSPRVINPAYPDSIKPLMDVNFPDPALINVDGKYYLFSTDNGVADGHIAIATAPSSGSPVTATGKGALAHNKLPSWVDKSNAQVWAPDVTRLNDQSGTFLLLYAALQRGAQPPVAPFIPPVRLPSFHCIGVARSSSVEGPYEAVDKDKPLLCEARGGGAIDPAAVWDGNRLFVAYKVDGNALDKRKPPKGPCGNDDQKYATPIKLQELDTSNPGRTIGDAKTLLELEKEDGAYIEGPAITQMEDGKWLMTFSTHCYQTLEYDVQYAFADSLAGPWTRQPNALLESGWYKLRSPGHAGIVDKGKRLIFHAANPDNPSVRQLYTVGIIINRQQNGELVAIGGPSQTLDTS